MRARGLITAAAVLPAAHVRTAGEGPAASTIFSATPVLPDRRATRQAGEARPAGFANRSRPGATVLHAERRWDPWLDHGHLLVINTRAKRVGFWGVAQLVEQRFLVPQVARSNRAAPANSFSSAAIWPWSSTWRLTALNTWVAGRVVEGGSLEN